MVLSSALPSASAAFLVALLAAAAVPTARCYEDRRPSTPALSWPGEGATWLGRNHPLNDWRAPPSADGSPATPEDLACLGDLPFGLENCVCEGILLGEAAGLAACGVLYTRCYDGEVRLDGREADDSTGLASIQAALDATEAACDSFTAVSCAQAGIQAVLANSICSQLMAGNNKCSAPQAKRIVEKNLEFICEPICPECPRVENTSAHPVVLPSTKAEFSEEFERDEAPTKAAAETKDKGPADDATEGCGSLNPALQLCTCDGGTLGLTAAEAACKMVESTCEAVDAPALHLKRPCDTESSNACIVAADRFAMGNEACAFFLMQGGTSCTPEKARDLFDAYMENVCDPMP